MMNSMTSEEVKKLPTILHILDTISGEEERLRNDPRWGPLLSNIGVEDKFEIYRETPNGPCALLPTSSCFNSFFRGQYEYYENCCPTIYRNKDKKDKIDLFISRLRSTEFELLLRTHPFVKLIFENGFTLNNLGKDIWVSLKVDYLGLAQHYELDTDMLDFTNNKWVAAFFAVCKKENGKYVPMDSDEYGVFYRYSMTPEQFLIENGDFIPEKKFSIIGLQPFKRPGEQKGFALKMEEGENLNYIKGIQKYFFRHDKMAAEIILNRMNKSKSLFPDDELELFAKKIKESRKLSIEAFKLTLKNYPMENMNEEMLKKACIERNVKLTNYPVVKFNNDIKKTFLNYWKKGGEMDFISKIVYRSIVC